MTLIRRVGVSLESHVVNRGIRVKWKMRSGIFITLRQHIGVSLRSEITVLAYHPTKEGIVTEFKISDLAGDLTLQSDGCISLGAGKVLTKTFADSQGL
jgi:hypothetical protein